MEPLLERPPEEGARRLALRHLDQAATAFPRLRDPSDAEALHDFRVALRRLRSCLKAYGDQLDDDLPKKLRRRLKKLADATGPGRDTEVQIEWLRGRSRHLGSHHRPGLAWLLARLEERMRQAVEEMADHIPQEFPRLEEELRRRLSTYTAEVHLNAAARPTLAEATASILRDQAEELRAGLDLVEGPADEERAHEARISAKRLRYLLEPFAEELPEAASAVKHMKGLQETLGELHDAHVLERELADSLEAAAVERARRLLEISLSGVPDEALLRAERRRVREPGVLALAKLNRARRDRLFDDLEIDWLGGQSEAFFQEVEALSFRLEGSLSPGTGERAGEREDGNN
ncbi:MAG: CHAD domain-containing protein [Acidobacteriota bacterium]